MLHKISLMCKGIKMNKDKLINSMRTKIKYLGRDLDKLKKTLEEEKENERKEKTNSRDSTN